ncbi:MAG: BlaI/MecI/CopY family transcriptional regulator [Clostridia bacterium]|nr:BlaI/MecI/CopY family transcriptional regulator [Clostridia bacterium]
MPTPKIFESEYRFCLILWENEPISCADIAKICLEKLDWKRTTTYTVIKRLTQRGFLKVENSVITSLYSKEEIQERELGEMVEKTFEGSLPAFVAAFSRHENLSEEEVAELLRIIREKKDK